MSKMKDLMEFSQLLNNKPKRVYFAVMQNKRFLPIDRNRLHRDLTSTTPSKKAVKPYLED